jgi:hypothetical protein
MPVSVGLYPSVTNLSITATITGALSLVFITKEVVFKDASLEQVLFDPEVDNEALIRALTSNEGHPDDPANKITRGLPIPDPAAPVARTLSGTLSGTMSGDVEGTLTGSIGGPLTGPVSGVLSGPVTGTLNEQAGQVGQVIGTAANAPGLLGQLRGEIPIAPVEVPVTVQVRWSVLDGDVTPPTPLVEGTDFFAPEGLTTSPTATFVFLPGIVRLSISTLLPPPARRIIHAEITLSAQGISSDPLPLDLPVLVPSLAIPTVLALFRNPNFAPSANAGKSPGVVLLVVPPDSPLASFDHLLTTLRALKVSIDPLSALSSPALSFAGFLLGLNSLISALDAPQPIVLIEAQTEIPFLNRIPVDRGVYTLPYFDADLLALNAEDRFDSLIFLGKSGDQAVLFNNPEFNGAGGQFTITVRQEMFAIIRDLRSDNPVHQPVHDPIDVFHRDFPPGGAWSPRTRDPIDWGHTVTTFAHEISSLKLILP